LLEPGVAALLFEEALERAGLRLPADLRAVDVRPLDPADRPWPPDFPERPDDLLAAGICLSSSTDNSSASLPHAL
jgi:hypothetical protein